MKGLFKKKKTHSWGPWYDLLIKKGFTVYDEGSDWIDFQLGHIVITSDARINASQWSIGDIAIQSEEQLDNIIKNLNSGKIRPKDPSVFIN
jgi:hypothetical protein